MNKAGRQHTRGGSVILFLPNPVVIVCQCPRGGKCPLFTRVGQYVYSTALSSAVPTVVAVIAPTESSRLIRGLVAGYLKFFLLSRVLL